MVFLLQKLGTSKNEENLVEEEEEEDRVRIKE